tara:strand:- start:127 stop:1224 length:1098 start_codon:yes stop_codon:yes gene_type:complete
MIKKGLFVSLLVFISNFSISQSIDLDTNLTDYEIKFRDSVTLINKYNEMIFHSRKEYNNGIEHFNNNNLNEAIQSFSNAIIIDSSFSKAYFYRAKCYDMFDDSLALIDYNIAFRYDSSDFSPIYSIAKIKSKSNIPEAITQYNFIISLDKNEEKAYYELGVLFYLQMYFHKAITAFSSSLDLIKDARVFNDRASCYRMIGDVDLAIKDYINAISLDSSLAFLYNNLASTYKYIDNFDSALYYYNLAVNHDENYIYALNNRAGMYIELDDLDNAMVDIDRVLLIDKNYAPAYNNKGVIHNKKKEYTKAVSFFDIAISIDNSYAKAYLNRGITKQILRIEDEACQDWLKASELGINLAKNYFSNDCK